MADLTTIARPYARAIFDLAGKSGDERARWSEMLTLLATVADHPQLQELLANPSLDRERKAGLMLDICGEYLSQAGANLVRLLADNNRLPALPAIASVYEALRAEAEKTVEAELIAAFEVSDTQREQLAKALSERLEREVVLDCKVDESLLGGAVIRAGDLVIDGSARGRLEQLAASLRQ
ncbi:MAG: F0F1 ATP synthase subunit delta [Candidatus Competibacterales bacterium]|nr:F0F1 ATP synthase subunit delta [Candidatus Competibacterales bacterium]